MSTPQNIRFIVETSVNTQKTSVDTFEQNFKPFKSFIESFDLSIELCEPKLNHLNRLNLKVSTP